MSPKPPPEAAPGTPPANAPPAAAAGAPASPPAQQQSPPPAPAADRGDASGEGRGQKELLATEVAVLKDNLGRVMTKVGVSGAPNQKVPERPFWKKALDPFGCISEDAPAAAAPAQAQTVPSGR